MKATLEFITPDEETQFRIAIKGDDFFCALRNIKNELRNHDKYDLPVKECIDRIREIVYDSGIDEIE